jgi:hypothetical protein
MARKPDVFLLMFDCLIKYWPQWTAGACAVVVSIWWIGRVDATVTRVDTLERSTNRIERKLDYFMGRMGVPYQGVSDGE